mmetsp:Transcript_38755/g.90081  ORF Transcript_38755/g.90081 Transcript_38755/m.90081 type:complete len:158 (+) Transcript_38755:463-936(+)
MGRNSMFHRRAAASRETVPILRRRSWTIDPKKTPGPWRKLWQIRNSVEGGGSCSVSVKWVETPNPLLGLPGFTIQDFCGISITRAWNTLPCHRRDLSNTVAPINNESSGCINVILIYKISAINSNKHQHNYFLLSVGFSLSSPKKSISSCNYSGTYH